MKVKINKIEYEVPFDLELITLSDYIEYQNEYGDNLDKEIEEILIKEYEDEDEKLVLIDNHLDKEALSWFSFWTKIDLIELRDEPIALPLLSSYRTLRFLLKSTEDVTDITKVYSWMGEKWQIQNFVINPDSDMSFNEIITSKEIMRQVYSLGKGKFFSLVYLSAIFFRKVGERFSDSMIHENSERLKLIQKLPLAYALAVSFFLRVCVNTWKISSAYSKAEAA